MDLENTSGKLQEDVPGCSEIEEVVCPNCSNVMIIFGVTERGRLKYICTDCYCQLLR